ncbi:MAG: hypothetical protein ACI9KE_004229, partial [Polyangiales bacterium]
ADLLLARRVDETSHHAVIDRLALLPIGGNDQ